MTVRSGLVQFHPALEHLLVPIHSVQQHPENPNNGDLEEIVTSIEVNGMYRPVYVQDSTNSIIAGNGTWTACVMLEAEQIPVIRLAIGDLEAKRIMLADNKIASMARRDPAIELGLLEELITLDSLLGSGYLMHEVETLRALDQAPAEPGEFDVWPTLCVQLSPEARSAYFSITASAGSDTERFQLLMRLAGWTG